jgi:microsomal dipeptidase-like Zn-dependent dipeptidase
MNVDLHAHYPMHLIPSADQTVQALVASTRGTNPSIRDRFRAQLVSIASRLANYPTFTSGPAVTIPHMKAGGFGAILSVLYSPFDEMDVTKLYGYGLPPEPHYFDSLVRQLELVEEDIASNFADEAVVARSPEELDAALTAGRMALVHAVEGGFALGNTPGAITENVAELASRGVAYVTVAHLVYRGVATNSAAIPFLPDWVYHLLFRQPRIGLTALGEAAIDAMVRNGVLIDITHMSERTIDDTFAMLDRIDPQRRVPVIASHIACRIGDLEYNLSRESIARTAERGGVMGVIFCEHYASDGVRHGATKTFDDTVEVVCAHIDRIHQITGSYDHIGLGSDLDGYIKPALPGLEHMGHMRALQDSLQTAYGADIAEKITNGNALRVLRAAWRASPPTT